MIEIKELIVRAVVDESQQATKQQSGELLPPTKQQLRDIVYQMLRSAKKKNER